MITFYLHDIISGVESWSGVLEWSGVKFGVTFWRGFWSGICSKNWSDFFGGFLESVGCFAE